MDNFKAVYHILSALEASMDYPQFDENLISASTLKVSEERRMRYLEMMADVGYIKGVRVYENALGERRLETDKIRITLKGLEYLQENSIMQRMYAIAKGLKDVIPGA